MEESVRLDRVFVFNDQLNFLIPHDWVEGDADDDGTYLYHAPGTESGWLRISLITSRLKENPAERLDEKHEEWRLEYGESVSFDSGTGNLVRVKEAESIEADSGAYIYFWYVVHSVLPDRLVEAVFTYTILKDRKDDPDTREEVNLLDSLVRLACFSPPVRSN